MWDASKCDLCGDCLTKCLYTAFDKDKAMAELKKLIEGKEAEILSQCITCCACKEYCPTGADPFDLICKMQEKTGTFPAPEATVALFDQLGGSSSEVIPGDPDKPILSLCVMESLIPDGVLSSQLFQGMTVAKGGDFFCYIGYVHIGKESPIEKNARKFIENLGRFGKDIVFLHDDCYAMAHAKIRDYGLKVPFKFMHLFEYLLNYLNDHRSSITKLGKKVAYQRPCASRYTPEKDVFLDELFELIGVERPPRMYEREAALCCTGPIMRVKPELSAEIQAKNINDAIECGADALVTLCPMCDRVMRRPTVQRGLRKIHITDLCRISLGEKQWPTS
jgi:Fe-S oxidoreductase